MSEMKKWHTPAKYEIEIGGHLGINWFDWFDDVVVECECGKTHITIDVIDQAALHGLLARIRDLGLPLISLQRINSTRKESKPVK